MDVPRISRQSAAAGTLIWIAWEWFSEPFVAAALFVLSPLVIFPLLLRPLYEREPSALLRALALAQLPCAALLPLALELDPGALALVLALPWAGWTGLLAIEALRRLAALLRPSGTLELANLGRSSELVLIAGLGFPLVGSGWLLLDRLDVQPFGFSPLIVLLTAVHFHHAGFTLPLSAGYLGRVYPSDLVKRVAGLVIVAAIPLVAIGITYSPLLEVVSACITAAAGIVVALGLLERARFLANVPALLFALSGASLLAGMIFAAAYALSEYRGVPWPDIMAMLDLHGAVNALGFGLLGAWAWSMSPPPGPSR